MKWAGSGVKNEQCKEKELREQTFPSSYIDS